MKNTNNYIIFPFAVCALLSLSVINVANAAFTSDEKLDEAIGAKSSIVGLGVYYNRVAAFDDNLQVIKDQAPKFDFDGDGCYPAAAFDRDGVQNPGDKMRWRPENNCSFDDFYDESNTYHRAACFVDSGDTYCVNFYSLYFQRDQTSLGIWSAGHRHDIENAATWFKNGVMTHVSASAHGDLLTKAVADVLFIGPNPAIVYHKDSILTHALRFANSNDVAYPEAPGGAFVTPTIVSYDEMYGDGAIQNYQLKTKVNNYDYGSASFPSKNSNFLTNINDDRPSSYPAFPASSIHTYYPWTY